MQRYFPISKLLIVISHLIRIVHHTLEKLYILEIKSQIEGLNVKYFKCERSR